MSALSAFVAVAFLAVGAANETANPASPRTLADVAMERLAAAEREGTDESFATARVALELAGPACAPALVARLGSDLEAGRGATDAWALGVACRPAVDSPMPPPRAVVQALLRALGSPDWECRLAAASSLGVLEATEAAPDVAMLLVDPERPPGVDGALWLALGGLGGSAISPLEALLERGGDRRWAETVTAVVLRHGRDAWPLLTRELETSSDASVRAAAATCLLLLAEPASACALAEVAGREPDPAIGRVLLQALAATQHPLARAFLAHAATSERDPDLRAAAVALSEQPLAPPPSPPDAPRLGVAQARERLRALALGRALPGDLRAVEDAASVADVPVIGRTLRALPLREDADWLSDHARLAQLRARLLCAADPDCAPREPKVGRPAKGDLDAPPRGR